MRPQEMDSLEEKLNKGYWAWIGEGGGNSQPWPGLPGSSQAGCFLPPVTPPHPGAGPRQGYEEGQGCGEHHLWQQDKCAGTRGHCRPGCPRCGLEGLGNPPSTKDSSFPLSAAQLLLLAPP